jgi:hypothetical protein
MKEFYQREEYSKIDEGLKKFYLNNSEINRLFRTNCFNLIKRRHFEDDRLKKFPILKETTVRENNE